MMKQAKFLSLTAACVLSLTSVMGGLQVSAAQQSAPVSSDVKIMALGDSITDGYWTGGGYRKYLYHELEEMGYSNIDMVGPKGSNSESFQYQGQTATAAMPSSTLPELKLVRAFWKPLAATTATAT